MSFFKDDEPFDFSGQTSTQSQETLRDKLAQLEVENRNLKSNVVQMKKLIMSTSGAIKAYDRVETRWM